MVKEIKPPKPKATNKEKDESFSCTIAILINSMRSSFIELGYGKQKEWIKLVKKADKLFAKDFKELTGITLNNKTKCQKHKKKK